MTGNKPAIASTGVIGAVGAILMGLAQLLGYAFTAEDQAAVTELVNQGFILVTGIITIVSGGAALWGRLRAKKQISGIMTAAPVASAPARDVDAATLNRQELDRILASQGEQK